jgi:hypothetical protein
METILMVREPSSVVAGEAYEGLRRQVVSAVSERWTHVSQLAQLDLALSHGTTPDMLAKLVDEWLDQAGVLRVSDPGHPDFAVLFEVVADGGGRLEVIEPAYLDKTTSRIIKTGRAQRAVRDKRAASPARHTETASESPVDPKGESLPTVGAPDVVGSPEGSEPVVAAATTLAIDESDSQEATGEQA